MDRFEDMTAFVAVVEAGSFTAAADRLDVARSVISRRVAALEERLGVQLLRRTTRRINLTDSGRGFYERSAALLADLEEAESAVAQQHGELKGRLKLALPLSFGVRHMLDPLAEFGRRHPRVSFELDFNDRRVDLLQEGVDLALRIGRLSDSNLIARKLFDAQTVICASPAFLDEHGAPERPDDLSSLPCLVYSNLAEPDRWACRDAGGRSIEVRVQVAMRASSGDYLCGAAAEGMGIVMQPTFIASDLIARGRLVPLLTDYRWPVTPAYAVYPPTRHLSYRVRQLIDFLAECFDGQPPWDRDSGV
ncbi:MAG: LysR family transcriptional regulator [Pseudomonadota bacterium]